MARAAHLSVDQRWRASWNVAVVVTVLGLGACPQIEQAPRVAQLEEPRGVVTVRMGVHAKPQLGLDSMDLLEGDEVVTGANSDVKVVFEGGNILALGPESILVIRREGGVVADFGAILVSGRAHVTSSGQGVRLILGTPFGLVELGEGRSEADVSLEDGIRVKIGEIQLLKSQNERTPIKAGHMLLEGMVVPIRQDGEETIVFEPMSFGLLANPRQVQVKRAGESNWGAVKKRDMLRGGDFLRTRKANGTQVQLGERAGISVAAQSKVDFKEAGTSDKLDMAGYALEMGSATVKLERTAQGSVRHEVKVDGQSVRVEPGAKQASVELRTNGRGRSQVTVRLGRAVLEDGTVVQAGYSVTLQKGLATSEPRPLAATAIRLTPRSSSEVHFSKEVPPVAFSWQEGAGDKRAYAFEVAKDRNFSQQVLAENFSDNAYVYDQFPPGYYYWRVKVDEKWQRGRLLITRDAGDGECKNCKRRNVVDDTGENTVVYFQKMVPAITLRWKAVPGASAYRVKVFREGEFDAPLVNKRSEKTVLLFPPGELDEGKYFWHKVAEDEIGGEVATGRMNSLLITYDNAVTNLAIRVPRPDARVRGRKLITTGEVQLGARLYVNGKRAFVDKKGRFREMVVLDKGFNRVVYRTLAADGIERFYVRDVYH